ncbi:twin-arginine translocation pathway signal [Mycobacterium kansasii]|uniref:twin-arginine translocation pathway signal n=1 Tax=Mycobacterium kansasii TaxID=1768 RepID=UPI00358DD4F4
MTVDDGPQLDDPTALPEDTAAPRRRFRVARRRIRRCLTRWRPILLGLLVIATTGFAAGFFYFGYRPDQQTDDAAARDAIRAASEGTVALLSYSPDSLSRDFDNARGRLTDDYQAYYERFTEQIVAPAAQRGQITTSARVIRAAAAELRPDSAVVLVFISLKTTSKDQPEPVKTTSSVRVTLRKVNGSWLIAKLDSL